MDGWLKDNLSAILGALGAAALGVYGFLKRVSTLQTKHEALEHAFEAHVAEAKPLMVTAIETRERVDSLEARTDERIKTILEQVTEGREDVRALTSTLLGLMEKLGD